MAKPGKTAQQSTAVRHRQKKKSTQSPHPSRGRMGRILSVNGIPMSNKPVTKLSGLFCTAFASTIGQRAAMLARIAGRKTIRRCDVFNVLQRSGNLIIVKDPIKPKKVKLVEAASS